nr:sulfatase-like hydrolase/transferase [Ilumatobacter sp.]
MRVLFLADTYLEATADWPDAVRPPPKAPNVVVILFDDLGFGQLSAFGGPIDAPHIGQLAAGGLRYTNFHTTALCSPSRAALLTGRNHHSVGFATIAEMSTGFPGYDSFLPKTAASIAEVLRLNGYSTYCTGKWHLTPTAEATAAGPFDRWPLGMGFERFYGFLPGETDQWHPILTSDNHRVPTPDTEGYHLSEDLVDRAIRMIRDQQQVSSGRPFFSYLPFGAVHCPFHAPEEYIERYRGRFDAGWDVVRRETFERQQAFGIVPSDNELPPRNPGVQPWSDLSDDARRLYAKQMEVFAGMVDHTDAQVGRLIAALVELDVLDDTVVMVLSDNGASQEGMLHGATNTERFRNLVPETVEEQLPFIDDLGGPSTDPHYSIGWAMAGNAPFRRCKRDTHRGGNTDPFIVHWPGGITDPGALRTQYHHIVDVYPTLLELAGVPVPEVVNGIKQMPIEGHSFAATLGAAAAPEVKTTQYYEMLGSRAVYHDGWMAVTWHKPGTNWNDDRWELYDQRTDYTQAWDLADEQPAKLDELIELWWDEARRHNVLPLDDRGRDRFIDPTRPAASETRDVYRYFPDSSPIPSPSLPVILNCPHSFTVRFRLDDPDDAGLLVSHGGSLAGWALFVRDRKVTYINNNLKLSLTKLSTGELPVGKDLSVCYEWDPSGPGIGDVNLFVDDRLASSVQDVRSAPRGYSMVQEGLSVGRAWGPPVDLDAYRGPFEFSGTLHVVE